MSIHSKILVHWTGKPDIEDEPVSDQPRLFIQRLHDYYQNGLFMKRTEENSIRFWRLKNIVRLCFTEIRLSQAENHAKRSGKLGIGFSRDFIINRDGRPVIYIPFEPYDGLLERSLTQIWEKSIDDETPKPMKYVLGFVKRMWNEHGDMNFEEMEWRIVYDENPKNDNITKGNNEGEFRFKFAPKDVTVIIFPDEATRKMALCDSTLQIYFSQHTPILVTIDDCKDF